MASLADVGDSTSLTLGPKGDIATIAISGTYAMTIALQREVGSPGSGAWITLKEWSTANATVSYTIPTVQDSETLRLIVTADTSGTATATITNLTDVLLETFKTPQGDVYAKIWEGGGVTLPDRVVLLADEDATILESNEGKTHVIANVSADRTFTLPVGRLGMHYRFKAQVGAADGHDWIFATPSTAVLFAGGVLMIDTDAAPATAAAVVADQSNDDAFQVNVPQGGTVIDMDFDGTYWVVSGVVLSTAAAAFS